MYTQRNGTCPDAGSNPASRGAATASQRARLAGLVAAALALTLSAGLLATASAMASGQEVVSWGNNKAGQLGDGLKGASNNTDKPVFACAPLWSGPVPCKASPSEHLKEVTAISAGGSHSLALLTSGEVVAWGAGNEGALGDGETSDKLVPVYVCKPEYAGTGTCPASERLKEVVAISAGDSYSNIALLKSGDVVTWGTNAYGQMGDGSHTPTPGYSDVPQYVCEPEMPYADECSKTAGPPYKEHFLTGVSAVSAAPDHDAAIMQPGGELLTWGVNSRGQLGQGDWNISNDTPRHVCEVEYTYTVAEVSNNHEPRCPSGRWLAGVELIAFGNRHNIAQFSGVYCVRVPAKTVERSPEEGKGCASRDGEPAQEGGGTGKEGKKGKKGKEIEPPKTWEEEGYEWIEEHANHAVVSFGNNEEGQLGDGLAVKPSFAAGTGGPAACESGAPCSSVPVHVCVPGFVAGANPCAYPQFLEPVSAVAAGGDHSLALNGAGEVLAWGTNVEGEQGNTTFTGPDTCSYTSTPCGAVPEAVAGGIVALAGGSLHELALEQSAGEVLAWGGDASGQVGDGTVAAKDTPTPVCAVGTCSEHLSGASAISAGNLHSLALGSFPSGGVVWSHKGAELPRGGPHVTVKTSGSLTINTESGPVACKVKDVEEIWNPATGNGEDRITTFVLKCKSALCPPKQATEVIPLGLPWQTRLTSGTPTRDEIESIRLEIKCSVSGKLDEYSGTLTPEVSGSTLVFGAGSGALEDVLHHKATVSGTDKLSGGYGV